MPCRSAAGASANAARAVADTASTAQAPAVPAPSDTGSIPSSDELNGTPAGEASGTEQPLQLMRDFSQEALSSSEEDAAAEEASRTQQIRQRLLQACEGLLHV